MLVPVRMNEVDDVAQAQPVDHVAERAAEDQRQAAASSALRARSRRRSQTSSADAHHERQRREQPALPARGIGQEAEGRAACCSIRVISSTGSTCTRS